MNVCITYNQKKDRDTVHTATFDNLDDAKFFWDTINYLRNEYIVLCGRPKETSYIAATNYFIPLK